MRAAGKSSTSRLPQLARRCWRPPRRRWPLPSPKKRRTRGPRRGLDRSDADRRAHARAGVEVPVDAAGGGVERVDLAAPAADEQRPPTIVACAVGLQIAGKRERPLQLSFGTSAAVGRPWRRPESGCSTCPCPSRSSAGSGARCRTRHDAACTWRAAAGVVRERVGERLAGQELGDGAPLGERCGCWPSSPSSPFPWRTARGRAASSGTARGWARGRRRRRGTARRCACTVRPRPAPSRRRRLGPGGPARQRHAAEEHRPCPQARSCHAMPHASSGERAGARTRSGIIGPSRIDGLTRRGDSLPTPWPHRHATTSPASATSSPPRRCPGALPRDAERAAAGAVRPLRRGAERHGVHGAARRQPLDLDLPHPSVDDAQAVQAGRQPADAQRPVQRGAADAEPAALAAAADARRRRPTSSTASSPWAATAIRRCRRAPPSTCLRPTRSMTRPVLLQRRRRDADRAAAGRADACTPSWASSTWRPARCCLLPRGIKFRVELPDGAARGYICENYGQQLRLPELGPIGTFGLANARDFLAPVAAYEDREGDFRARGQVRRRAVGGRDRSLAARHRRLARQLRAVQVRPQPVPVHQHGDLRSSRPVDLLRAGVADRRAGHVEHRDRLLPAALDAWPSTRSGRRRFTATSPASSSA